MFTQLSELSRYTSAKAGIEIGANWAYASASDVTVGQGLYVYPYWQDLPDLSGEDHSYFEIRIAIRQDSLGRAEWSAIQRVDDEKFIINILPEHLQSVDHASITAQVRWVIKLNAQESISGPWETATKFKSDTDQYTTLLTEQLDLGLPPVLMPPINPPVNTQPPVNPGQGMSLALPPVFPVLAAPIQVGSIAEAIHMGGGDGTLYLVNGQLYVMYKDMAHDAYAEARHLVTPSKFPAVAWVLSDPDPVKNGPYIFAEVGGKWEKFDVYAMNNPERIPALLGVLF